MNKKLRVGVMGCAQIAERMVIPAMQSSKHLELVAVASRNPDKASDYGSKFHCEGMVGYQHLLNRNDIDIIYMPLPTALHLQWGIKSLEAGKHLLLEKSLAENYTDAKTIVENAKRKMLLVQENFMFEFHRQLTIIKDIIDSGILGGLRCVRSSFGFPPFQDSDNIRYQKSLGGGALLDAGAYTLKVASLLLGSGLEVLGATLTIDRKIGVDIAGGILLCDRQGVVIETAFGFDNYYQCSLELWGSKGKLIAERIFTAGPGVVPIIRIETPDKKEVMEIEPDNHFRNLLDDFAMTIKSGCFAEKYDAILDQSYLIQAVKEKAVNIYK